ncbi:hypothetical protein [Aeromicrobium sp.]|uniref:hypothetical protein n=1 Tax=Aeromicrobium sp. TaxID=1871063 RepID=UPI00199DCBBE|nr:hypothetical protein [Aeromicrobium sp.]MBC7631604.1 hypothetical protein [Aeromicrobium sp.]
MSENSSFETRVFKEKGTCCVWISLTEAGELRLSGQDLGGFMGTSEYEYVITVQPDDFGTICTALGEPVDADIIEVMCARAEEIFDRGERTWLTDLGIDAGFSNWHSFD